jgi:hypothetical protein
LISFRLVYHSYRKKPQYLMRLQYGSSPLGW